MFGSVLGKRFRIHKTLDYGSNSGTDPQHWVESSVDNAYRVLYFFNSANILSFPVGLYLVSMIAGKWLLSCGRHLWALNTATNRAWAIFVFILLLLQLGSGCSALAATCERSTQRQTEPGRSAARHWHQDEQTLSGRKIIKMGRGGFR